MLSSLRQHLCPTVSRVIDQTTWAKWRSVPPSMGMLAKVRSVSVDVTKPIDIKHRVDNHWSVAYFSVMSSKIDSLAKVSFRDALILCLMFANVIKSFLLVIIDIDFETSILLSDISALIGGVRGYVLSNIGLSFVLGLLIHQHFHLTITKSNAVWSEVFHVLFGRQSPQKIGFCSEDSFEFEQLLVRSHVVFRLMNVALVGISKDQLQP